MKYIFILYAFGMVEVSIFYRFGQKFDFYKHRNIFYQEGVCIVMICAEKNTEIVNSGKITSVID
jgi:hypothetical protein